ncbi:MAG: hypothetical protein IPH12_01170 [Saprospirales bacterium]|nr:hypothetical protein [Saprospirales bacterium]
MPTITCPDNVTVGGCRPARPPRRLTPCPRFCLGQLRRQPDVRLQTGPLTGGAAGHDHAGHKDDCGNTKTCNQAITVDDNTSRRSPARTTSRWNAKTRSRPARPAAAWRPAQRPARTTRRQPDLRLRRGPLTGGACGARSREHKVTDDCGNTNDLQPDDPVAQHDADDHRPDNVTVECEDEVPACPASRSV